MEDPTINTVTLPCLKELADVSEADSQSDASTTAYWLALVLAKSVERLTPCTNVCEVPRRSNKDRLLAGID